LLDSLAGVFGRNQTALVSGLHSLLQDAAGGRAYLNSRLVANKRIDALGLSHTFTVASKGCGRKRIVRFMQASRKYRRRRHSGSNR